VLAVPEVAAVPLAGKMSWVGFLPYDVHLQAGPAWALPTSGERSGRHFAACIGGGVRVFFANSFSSSFDYRALMGDEIAHAVALSVGYWPSPRRWDVE